MNENEPPMKCRENEQSVKTVIGCCLQDGRLPELLVMRQAVYRRHDFYLGLIMEQGKSTKDDMGKAQEGKTPLRLNTDDLVDGGSNRSSEEIPVMGGERRVGIIQLELPLTTSNMGSRKNSVTAKEIPITRSMVWRAYKKVRSNKGSAGVDGRSKIFPATSRRQPL